MAVVRGDVVNSKLADEVHLVDEYIGNRISTHLEFTTFSRVLWDFDGSAIQCIQLMVSDATRDFSVYIREYDVQILDEVIANIAKAFKEYY